MSLAARGWLLPAYRPLARSSHRRRVKTLDGDLNVTVTANDVVANLVLPYVI